MIVIKIGVELRCSIIDKLDGVLINIRGEIYINAISIILEL